MGKGNRIKRERGPVVPSTHEPAEPQNWPDGHVQVALTGDDAGECIVVTIHGIRHYLHSTTAQALNQRLEERLAEWDKLAKSSGAPGVLDSTQTEKRGNRPFDATVIAGEIRNARELSVQMVRGASVMFGNNKVLLYDHLPFMQYIERAQAFDQGVVDMVENGNPLAAGTLLRSFAENMAVAFYLEKHPAEYEKLRPGAQQGLPMGKVVAEASKHLPNFKEMYKHLSAIAHPSGSGSYHTFQFEESSNFTWQSHPTFRTVDDARSILGMLGELRQITAGIIHRTALEFRTATQESRDL